MKRTVTAFLTLILLVASMAFAQNSHKSIKSSDDVKKYIQDQEDAFGKALQSKNIDKIGSMFWNSNDLVVYDPVSNFKGYNDFHDSWMKRFAAIDFTNYSTDNTDVNVQGNVAIETGTFTVSKGPRSHAGNEVTPRGGSDENNILMNQTTVKDLQGRFLRVWEVKNGKWVVVASHTSYPVPPQAQNYLKGQSNEIK